MNQKFRTYPIVLVAVALAAVPCAAQAAPAGVITSDTTLKFGQKGVLTLDGWDPTSEKFKSRKAPVAVRVLKIDKGKASDLKNQGLPASATGMVPYYIRSEVSYAGADWEGSPPLFSGQFSDGSSASALITSRDVGPCAYTSTITLNKKQRTGLNCRVVLAPAKVPVVSAYLFHPVGEHKSIKVTWNKTGK
jgi:hypothetical protein